MELFVGLALELVVSIFLCFVLAKFVSSSNIDCDHGCGDDKKITPHCKFSPENEAKKGFSLKTVKVDYFCSSESCGRKLLDVQSLVSSNLAETFDSIEEVKGSELFEENEKSEIEVVKDENEEVEILKLEGDEICGDDWEGIERSELERVFGAAVVYVGNADDKISRFGSDLKLKLYGLHKVATEGPCLVPQPMALKVSARAKWNAWQQLGNMNPELAMENYIDLLSSSIPNWIDDCGKEGKHNCADTKASWKLSSDIVERKIEETTVESKLLA